MKLVTWNCNMAYRRKAHLIHALNPDIVVVPECEHPKKLNFSGSLPTPTDILWFGNNQNKGLGIFSYSKYCFQLLDCHNSKFQMVIPISVSGGHYEFTLFSIWANNPNDRDGQYIEQVYKAVEFYDDLLTNTKSILIGDFNSNKIWDKKHRQSNHSKVVQILEAKGILSTYHVHYNQNQGTEIHPTLYMYRHKNKPYHIDYCFASKHFIDKLIDVEVGEFDYWGKYSDHVPVIVTFENG